MVDVDEGAGSEAGEKLKVGEGAGLEVGEGCGLEVGRGGNSIMLEGSRLVGAWGCKRSTGKKRSSRRNSRGKIPEQQQK